MKHVFSLAAAALVALTAGASAQAQAPAQAMPSGPPEVKDIGSFVVRCYPVKSPSPCDMYEERDNKDTRQRVLGFSIAFWPGINRYVTQIAVPLGVSIEKGLVIQTGSFTSAMLPYRRCDRQGCYVEMVMEKAAIDNLAHSTGDAKIKIVADSGKSFDIPLEMNGFTAAHDAMVDSAKAKASPMPGADDAAAPAKK